MTLRSSLIDQERLSAILQACGTEALSPQAGDEFVKVSIELTQNELVQEILKIAMMIGGIDPEEALRGAFRMGFITGRKYGSSEALEGLMKGDPQ